MATRLNPLGWNTPIVDAQGRPTPEFQQKWKQQTAINSGIPKLSTKAEVSAVLDVLGATAGSLLLRGASQWAPLATPGGTAKFLRADGSYAQPDITALAGYPDPADATKYLDGSGAWSTPAGGGGGGDSTRFAWERASNGVPSTDNFTILNSGTAGTLDVNQQTYSITVVARDDGGSDQNKALAMSLPSTSFDIYAKIVGLGLRYNYGSYGIGVRNSSSNRYMKVVQDFRAGGGVYCSRYNDFTSFNSDAYSNAPVPFFTWFRINSDGSKFTFFVSNDGVEWIQVFQENISNFVIAPDQAIVVFNPGNNATGTVIFSLIHFEVVDNS